MKWFAIGDKRRADVVQRIRQMVGLEIVSRVGPHRQLMEDLLVGAETLEDVATFRKVESERQRIRRELAFEAADRCYQRAMSRAAQIKVNPKDERELTLKAEADRAAGDDVMRAAGLRPAEHPRDEELRRRFAGLITGVWKSTEFLG